MKGLKKFNKFMFDQGWASPITDFIAGDWKQGLKGIGNNAAMAANLYGKAHGMPINIGRPFDNDDSTPIFQGRQGMFDKLANSAGSAVGAGSGAGGMGDLGSMSQMGGGFLNRIFGGQGGLQQPKVFDPYQSVEGPGGFTGIPPMGSRRRNPFGSRVMY